jgi:xanthine dehydrogenase YagS FAD-binding subunit
MSDYNHDQYEMQKALSRLEEQLERPADPEYLSVHSVEDAVRVLAEHGREARLLAGGLDLVGLMKNRIVLPRVLVNIKPIDRLKYMAATGEGLRIGALIRIRELEDSDLIRHRQPMLAEAARQIGSPHVRHMASIAGNLCQQTRCWYYRRSPETGLSFDCRRKGSGQACHALGGEDQYHAVIGRQACSSAFPSDMGVVLSALDARVRLSGPDGDRNLPVDEMYGHLGPNLDPGQIITSVFVPERDAETRQKFNKFRLRKSIDFAVASVAVSCRMKGTVVEEARIFLGGVAPLPYRARLAEEVLAGRRLTPELAEQAGAAALAGAEPSEKNAYKVQIARTLVRRALLDG